MTPIKNKVKNMLLKKALSEKKIKKKTSAIFEKKFKQS
jgi:hypothetical protein